MERPSLGQSLGPWAWPPTHVCGGPPGPDIPGRSQTSASQTESPRLLWLREFQVCCACCQERPGAGWPGADPRFPKCVPSQCSVTNSAELLRGGDAPCVPGWRSAGMPPTRRVLRSLTFFPCWNVFLP